MRIEYRIVQKLMWDNEFRRLFLEDRYEALQRYYPECRDTNLFLSERASISGLEEEAFRRMAGVCRTSREIFPQGHSLLISFYGNHFFEQVLMQYLATSNFVDSMLEVFDGYIVGPFIIKIAETWPDESSNWIKGVLIYEWAVWQARRVAVGWPPLHRTSLLSPGTTLVSADFDLPNLLKEVGRLDSASVCADVYKWRIAPSVGSYYAAIFPKEGNVARIQLDPEHFFALMKAEKENNCNLVEDLRNAAESAGLILRTSFLCCPGDEYPNMAN